MSARPLLRVFGKPHCCLCDEALEAIEDARREEDFEVEEVNILSDPTLYERYRDCIPVGELDGKEVFRFRTSPRSIVDAVRRGKAVWNVDHQEPMHATPHASRPLPLVRGTHSDLRRRPAAPAEPLRDWALFLREALTNPRAIGAVFPSSPGLGRRMAEYVQPSREGVVIELGAGTGVVTQALLDRGVPRHRLLVVERSVGMADLLRSRFPGVRIFCGDAAELRSLLRSEKAAFRGAQVVSSLPLRSLPPETVQNILREIAALLRASGNWIQFTYSIAAREVPSGFVRRETSFVWRNIPPARIDVFTPVRETEKGNPPTSRR